MAKPRPPRFDTKAFASYEEATAGLSSRGAALDLLRAVRAGSTLADALTGTRTFTALEGPDRAFARQLATTVLRRRNTLDALYEPILERPLKPTQHEVRGILRLAAAQILLMRTPPHAAVSTAVDLSRERRDTAGFAKLINAICRRMTEIDPAKVEAVPARTDTPGWLWRKLERAYGVKAARAIALAHREEPPIDLTLRTPEDRDDWASRLEAAPIGPNSLRRSGGGRIEDLEGYEEGAWWIQDVAATLPVQLAGPLGGKTAIDLCAAPGGKTLQLCAGGAKVTAVDISAPRLARLEENLARTGLSADCIVSDAGDFEPSAPADIVLLDAPCTATGTVRRHPDLLWKKQEGDAAALVVLQDRLLDHAAGMVTPGGLLIFATCSLLPEEGKDRATAFLKRHGDFERVPVEAGDVGGLPVIDRDGDVRTHPGILAERGGMDGFYAARFRKKG